MSDPRELWNMGTKDLMKGPRMKSQATIQLESVVSAFLNEPSENISGNRNAFGEVEINVGSRIYNLTQIIQHQPDFEHLHFTNDELNTYANFVTKGAANTKPMLPYVGIPTKDDYIERDTENLHKDLRYAEKLAITIFTMQKGFVWSTSFYEIMQRVLRENADEKNFNKLDSNNLTKPLKQNRLSEIKEALLAICMASHGLTRPQKAPKSSDDEAKDKNKIELLHRTEANNPATPQRISDIENNTVTNTVGMTSTTANQEGIIETVYNTKIITLAQPVNGMARDIVALSARPEEQEKVLVAGAQIKYVSYDKDADSNSPAFLGVPVRTIENIPDANAYSRSTRALHDLNMVKSYLEEFKQKNSKALYKESANQQYLQDAIRCIDQCLSRYTDILKQKNHAPAESLDKAFDRAMETLHKDLNALIIIVQNNKSISSSKLLKPVLSHIDAVVNRVSSMLLPEEKLAEAYASKMTEKSTKGKDTRSILDGIKISPRYQRLMKIEKAKQAQAVRDTQIEQKEPSKNTAQDVELSGITPRSASSVDHTAATDTEASVSSRRGSKSR